MKTYTVSEQQVKDEIQKAEAEIEECHLTTDALYWLGWKAAFASIRKKGA